MRRTYTIRYIMTPHDSDRFIDVIAGNKAEAYDIAVYEAIPAKEGSLPYAARVSSSTSNNGNYHAFNTVYGMPY